MAHVNIIMGGGAAFVRDQSPEAIKARFKILESHGITTIDTAQIYGPSEELLGRAKAGSRFAIDTKTPGGWRSGSTRPDILAADAKASLQRLGIEQVDVFYFHGPDASVPLSDQLHAMNELHRKGMFRRFGLSNYDADEIQRVYSHCEEHGYVRPSVYQGTYNPVGRHMETLLLPKLRQLGIAFYAYSPIGGGFLTKTKEQILGGAGRFNSNDTLSKMWTSLYAKPAMLSALDVWEKVAIREGIPKAELANRWVACSSSLSVEKGDAIIIGSSSPQQLQQTIEGIERGPLSDEAVKSIDEIWKIVEHDAPIDNWDTQRKAA